MLKHISKFIGVINLSVLRQWHKQVRQMSLYDDLDDAGGGQEANVGEYVQYIECNCYGPK